MTQQDNRPSNQKMQLNRHLATTGLLLGTFFFTLSMSPSLLPQTALAHGVIMKHHQSR